MKLNNRLFYLLAGALAFFLFAKCLEIFCDSDRMMQQYARTISTDLQTKQQQIKEVITNDSLINNLVSTEKGDLAAVEALSKVSYGLFIYQNDSLVFWSNSVVPLPDQATIDTLQATDNVLFLQLSNGYYALQKWQISTANSSNFVISSIPIKWIYTESLSHLKPHFEAKTQDEIPASIKLTQQATDFPIYTADEKVLAYLNATTRFSHKQTLRWLLVLYLVGFIAWAWPLII